MEQSNESIVYEIRRLSDEIYSKLDTEYDPFGMIKVKKKTFTLDAGEPVEHLERYSPTHDKLEVTVSTYQYDSEKRSIEVDIDFTYSGKKTGTNRFEYSFSEYSSHVYNFNMDLCSNDDSSDLKRRISEKDGTTKDEIYLWLYEIFRFINSRLRKTVH